MHGAIVSVLVGGLVGVSPTAMAHTIETDQSKFQRVDQPIALKVGVAATGLGLIAIELWWFLSSRTKAQTNQKTEEGHQSVQSKNGL
ncbi:hypothetical protein S7335_4469 [Synechococcus sp. PCC 7335]|uniref:hypothetical protein n=1 Tax=Synechococcus sp. (strain ATCC 29403 / PCC 7335) TaxID=91464 RepID=UPI00017EE0DD|nr:hypothetical protein [Synechococcus sp. PCC 7335]EDX86763.1 hypothetical protein S7335_4469 [Synechococcus sp. PCC 7335]